MHLIHNHLIFLLLVFGEYLCLCYVYNWLYYCTIIVRSNMLCWSHCLVQCYFNGR